MMNAKMTCGTPMMIGMALVAVLLVTALGLFSAAAIRYLRSGVPIEGHDAPFDPRGER